MMYCLHYLKHYVHKTSSYLPSFKHIETPAGIRSLGLALFLAKSRTLPVITCEEHRTVVSGLGNLGYGKWCILVYPQKTYFFAGKMMIWRPKMTQFVEISAPCSQILLSGNLTACYVKPSSTFYNTYIYIQDYTGKSSAMASIARSSDPPCFTGASRMCLLSSKRPRSRMHWMT